jgi:hypothetical protein
MTNAQCSKLGHFTDIVVVNPFGLTGVKYSRYDPLPFEFLLNLSNDRLILFELWIKVLLLYHV